MSDSEGFQQSIDEFKERSNKINTEELLKKELENLKNWYDATAKSLNDFYTKKVEEMKRKTNEMKKEHEQIGEQITSMESDLGNEDYGKDQSSILKAKRSEIQRKLESIEFECSSIKINPVEFDENLLSLSYKFDLSRISIDHTDVLYQQDDSGAIAANENHILFHTDGNLSFLDKKKEIVKKYPWNQSEWIRNICWSQFLNSFIVLTTKKIVCIDEFLREYSPLKNFPNQNWFSSTCSDEHLFLSTFDYGSSVFVFNLLNWSLFKEWKSPTSCDQNRGILDLCYHDKKLALITFDRSDKNKSFCLKLAETFETIWSLQISKKADPRLSSCISINGDEWIIVDGSTKTMFQITSEGKIYLKRQLEKSPYRIALFGNDQLVLSSEESLDIYRKSNWIDQ